MSRVLFETNTVQTRINIIIIAEQCVRVCESCPRTHNNIMYNIYIYVCALHHSVYERVSASYFCASERNFCVRVCVMWERRLKCGGGGRSGEGGMWSLTRRSDTGDWWYELTQLARVDHTALSANAPVFRTFPRSFIKRCTRTLP